METILQIFSGGLQACRLLYFITNKRNFQFAYSFFALVLDFVAPFRVRRLITSNLLLPA